MEWLNYQHLFYFWTVAREGSIARACTLLHLSPPTVSAQIHALEDALGEKLFTRKGRGLELTPIGRVAANYAREIFTLGQELLDTVHDRPTGQPRRVSVGATDVVPKLLVRRLLGGLRGREDPFHVTVREGPVDRLLVELAAHALDVILADGPAPAGSPVRAFARPLVTSGVSFHASPSLARRWRRRFPAALASVPVLLPGEGSALRRDLDGWFRDLGVRPTVAVEADDSALLHALGQDGAGLFPVVDLVAEEVRRQYHVERLGPAGSLKVRFYALTVARRVAHPGVLALLEGVPAGEG